MPDLTLFAVLMSWEVWGWGQLEALVACRGTCASCLCLEQLLGHPQILSGHWWKSLLMKTGGVDEAWASETTQVFTLRRFSGISMSVQILLQHSPHSSVLTTHQSPPSGIAKRLVLSPWQEALRDLVSFWEETWNGHKGLDSGWGEKPLK